MKRYEGIVSELLQRRVPIEAEDAADAKRQLEIMYKQEKLVLSARDHVATCMRVKEEKS